MCGNLASGELPWLCSLVRCFGTGCRVEVEAEPVVAAAVDPEPEAPKPDHIWPPRVGERYPNLQLLDSFGERIALESLGTLSVSFDASDAANLEAANQAAAVPLNAMWLALLGLALGGVGVFARPHLPRVGC